MPEPLHLIADITIAFGCLCFIFAGMAYYVTGGKW